MGLTISRREHDLEIEKLTRVDWSGPHPPTDRPFYPLWSAKHYAGQALCCGAKVKVDRIPCEWTEPTFPLRLPLPIDSVHNSRASKRLL
jgi:hypothetical protein